jgi:hypothetical protein
MAGGSLRIAAPDCSLRIAAPDGSRRSAKMKTRDALGFSRLPNRTKNLEGMQALEE